MTDAKVFAVNGVDPEQLAYGFARYSRSSSSFQETLDWMKEQSDRASNFLDTFYYQYGHASIGDMAMIPLCLEGISMIAAIEVEHEQLWSGQERSTRYQDFTKSGYVTPPELEADITRKEFYTQAVENALSNYNRLFSSIYNSLLDTVKGTATADVEGIKRTLKARAFDVARSSLPYAVKTSVGQITSARTLESQISRLLASRYAEVGEVARLMYAACSSQPFNPFSQKLATKLADQAPDFSELTVPHPVAPTLAKYVGKDLQTEKLAETMTEIAREKVQRLKVADNSAPTVTLHTTTADPFVEAAATFIYRYSHISYAAALSLAQDMTHAERVEIYDLAFQYRGKHDPVARELHGGYTMTFDILMDGKGMQDFFRHRNCIQIRQELTDEHGFLPAKDWFALGLPENIVQNPEIAGAIALYDSTMAAGAVSYAQLAASVSPVTADYILPVGYRRRSLFKMTPAQAVYMIETRSKSQGHYSYRKTAVQMWEEIGRIWPEIARHIRVTPFENGDFLTR
jgi:thymidylate synthase ThyX